MKVNKTKQTVKTVLILITLDELPNGNLTLLTETLP